MAVEVNDLSFPSLTHTENLSIQLPEPLNFQWVREYEKLTDFRWIRVWVECRAYSDTSPDCYRRIMHHPACDDKRLICRRGIVGYEPVPVVIIISEYRVVHCIVWCKPATLQDNKYLDWGHIS